MTALEVIEVTPDAALIGASTPRSPTGRPATASVADAAGAAVLHRSTGLSIADLAVAVRHALDQTPRPR